jgi:hypothetical protein
MIGKSHGCMLIWNNIDDGFDGDFNEWYSRQHLHERVSLPGFIRARRFRAIDAEHKYLAMYETESSAAMSSEQYLRSVNNPLPSTRLMISHFKDWTRTVQIVQDQYGDDGGVLAAIRITTTDGSTENTSRCLSRLSPAKLAGLRGMIGAAVLREDLAVTSIQSAEKNIGMLAAEHAHWTIVLEGIDATSVLAAVEEVRSSLRSVTAVTRCGIYQLISAKNHETSSQGTPNDA